jgi:L-fuconolactonase
MRIDSHHHLWDLEIAQRGWLAGEVLAPINHTFSMDDFYAERASAKIDKSILVQTLSDYEEMKEFFNVAENHDSIVGVVAWIDTSKSDCFEKLETYLDLPGANKLVGIRDGAQGRTDTEWLVSEQVVKNVNQLVLEGLTFDLLVDPPHLAASAKLVKQCPNTTFILDHIGKPNIGKGDNGELKEWSKLIEDLAANQNVSCKVSGMVTEANWKAWKNEDFKKYFDVVLNSFGIDRIMYGSDWPVCKLAASYEQVANLAEYLVVDLSQSEKEKFWSKNAINAYGI